MTGKIYIYHFVGEPLKGSFEFFRQISKLNGIVCFDLEDSVMDVENDNRNAVLKENRREKIIDFFDSNSNDLSQIKFGIRINNYGSENYKKDLRFLEFINSHVRFDSVFLPKVENPNDINITIEMLKNHNVSFSELIPVIESKGGMNNLGKIVKEARNNFDKLSFGHCDYNLDNSFFPFHHQDSKTYWRWLNMIFSTLKYENKVLINSPFLFLNNDKMFNKILKRLMKKCGSFGQITMCLRQTELCKGFNGFSEQEIDNIPVPGEIKKYAQKIVFGFNQYRLGATSFAVDSKRVLISPQEYLAAKEYLNNTKI